MQHLYMCNYNLCVCMPMSYIYIYPGVCLNVCRMCMVRIMCVHGCIIRNSEF